MTDAQQPPGGGPRPDEPAGMPYMPPPPEAYGAPDASPVERPPSVRNAVRLMYVGAVLTAIDVIVALVTIGSLHDQLRSGLRRSGNAVTDAQVNAAVTAAVAAGVIVGIIGVLLWLWMAWKNGQGRQWARIVATILGVLNIVDTIYAFVGGRAVTASAAVSALSAIVAIVVLILLYRPDANRYFQAQSAPAPYRA